MLNIIKLVLNEMPFAISGQSREEGVHCQRAGRRTRGQVRGPETKCDPRGVRERGEASEESTGGEREREKD